MKRYRFIFLLVIFVLAFAGCGDGSGSHRKGGGGTGDTAGLCFTSSRSTVVSIIIKGTLDNIPALDYSKDGLNWSPIALVNDSTVEVTALSEGEKVYLRARNTNNSFSKDLFNYIHFIFTGDGSIAASGNIMSLLDKTLSSTEIPCDNCFCRLFENCTALTRVPALPAVTLTSGCYQSMFIGCTNLMTAPELPAITLADYCYNYMFYGCTNLVTAPELPATELADYCYYGMFSGCTSLVNTPTLPATELVDGCYASMFGGCTSLVTAPALPATTIAASCYRGMFNMCTNLVTAPDLPATELKDNCYTEMFFDCENLNYLKVYFTDWKEDKNATKNWVDCIYAGGTFYYKTGLDVSKKNGSHVPVYFSTQTF